MSDRRRITCIYANTPGFSGQRFASEILTKGLRERGWHVDVILTPAQNRLEDAGYLSRLGSSLVFVARLIWAWIRGSWEAFRPRLLHVNLGQTHFSMLREGWPLIVRGFFHLHSDRAVVSLHGHVFMGWGKESREARLLRRLSRSFRLITILGPKQKQALCDLGIPLEKIVVMDNTCLLSPLTPEACQGKHEFAETKPVSVLYLSSLIETKGYPDFVEGIVLLATEDRIRLDAKLCGKIALDASSHRFTTREMAESWLRDKLDQVNRSKHVRLTWIDGAWGGAKDQLFREAQIFVLPSRYRVEAQPIAILEAMASGCAVISTTVGEIPSMMSPTTPILLADPTAQAICNAIKELATNTSRRIEMATSGLYDFQSRFAYEQHVSNWENILGHGL